MSKQEYEFHPYASVLPMLGIADANELAADIQAHGLREDIVLFEGKILDGRNRYKACKTVNVEPRFVDLNGDGDPIDFIVSKNIARRHLTQSQKAVVKARILELPRGNPNLGSSKTPTNPKGAFCAPLETIAEAAKKIDVSPRTLKQAKQVIREAPSETILQVERGEKSVATAVKEIKAEKEKEEAAKERHLDKTGYVIPESIYADWQQADTFRSTLSDLHKVKLSVERSLENSDLSFREIGKDSLIELTNAWTTLRCVLPYAVCPTCQGRNREKCSVCKGRGFVSEFAYKTWFPDKTIEIRERAIRK